MNVSAVAAAKNTEITAKESFEQNVIDTLEKWLPGDTKFQIRKIMKPNDRVLDGLIISDEHTEVAPTIYLDPYYDAFTAGGATFDEIIENIFRLYKDNRTETSFDQESFLKWDKAKDKITYRLLNRKANEKFLEDVPFVSFLDLAVVFSYLITIDDAGQGSIVIHKCHAESWGVDADELYEAAKKNTAKLLPVEYKPMSEMLADLMPGSDDMLPEDIPDMLVLSNKTKTYGAAAILYKDVLHDIAEKMNCDLWMLPSSVHEVLLLPKEGDANILTDLSAMVREVNATQVPDGEILSDHAYLYDRKTGEFRF